MTKLEIVDSGNITAFITALAGASQTLFGELPCELIDEVVAQVANRGVSIREGEADDMGDTDLYDVKSECVIGGMKLAMQAVPGDTVFTAYTDDDAGFDAQYTFWFLAKSEADVVNKLRDVFTAWADGKREERGILLPVPDLGPELDTRGWDPL